MKYLTIVLVLLFVSCSETEIIENNIFSNGNYWRYRLDTHDKRGDSIELFTKIEVENNEFHNKLVNEWVYKVSFYSNSSIKSHFGPKYEVSSKKLELSSPILNNDYFWHFLPKLQVDKSLNPNSSSKLKMVYKKNTSIIKNYDVNGKQLEENKKSELSNIEYPYTLIYLGKVYYSNTLIKDSCDHFQIRFNFPMKFRELPKENFILDYFFHDKFGFVFIRINKGETDYFEMNVTDLKVLSNQQK